MTEQSFQLSEQQLNFFHTFGYLGFPQLMADRAAEIVNEFEAVWAGRGSGHNGKTHDGTARSCIVPFIDQRERLASLIDDPRIHGIATSLLGDDFNYMGSDGNYYVGDTRWHSDGWHKEILHIKLAFYLDPLTAETGALRVIPGSHRLGDRYAEGLQAEIRKSTDVWGVEGRDLPAIAPMLFVSTTTPNMRPLAATPGAACSPSTCVSGIPKPSCKTCATTSAARRASGSTVSTAKRWCARQALRASVTWSR
jgi:hypothetical protein